MTIFCSTVLLPTGTEAQLKTGFPEHVCLKSSLGGAGLESY